MKAWRSGGAPGIDGLELAEIAPPFPGPGELLVRVEAASVNFSDLLMIGDRYQVRPERPFIPGQEVAGVVEAAGPGAAIRPGERIASKLTWGGFAELAVVRDDMAIRLPDALGFADGAALPVVYTTAVVALTETASVGAGDRVLVFAATGGMGVAAIQVAKALGARVVAVATGPEKAAVARAEGADAVIPSDAKDFVDRVMEATDGQGAGIVVDTVGGAATARALDCLAWRGELLVAGFLSGEVAKIPAHRLLLKGAAAKGVYWDHDRDRALVERAVGRVLEMVESGAIRPRVDTRYRLADLPRALRALERRETIGKLVLAT
ncbi:MAG: NADPH:quinone oxidoreductase family protein [Defluviicoccus sp.]|nr:NADPH:quinone oxidoreductase family protein [Defluviicoccus sp.]MDE0277204.1 NADPH:quinone oxidoreductase family protein [Defluviicoccus sp.]